MPFYKHILVKLQYLLGRSLRSSLLVSPFLSFINFLKSKYKSLQSSAGVLSSRRLTISILLLQRTQFYSLLSLYSYNQEAIVTVQPFLRAIQQKAAALIQQWLVFLLFFLFISVILYYVQYCACSLQAMALQSYIYESLRAA